MVKSWRAETPMESVEVPISIYALAIETFVPALNTLSALLQKGADHARHRNIDPETLTGGRLAPDMFPLSTQVQLACHHALDGVARLIGERPPKIENKDQSLDDLQGLIGKTIADLKCVSETAFEGAEDRSIEMPLQGSLIFRSDGLKLLRDWTIPHFYFHVVTTYDILRNHGVELGKRDYMSRVAPYIQQRSDR